MRTKISLCLGTSLLLACSSTNTAEDTLPAPGTVQMVAPGVVHIGRGLAHWYRPPPAVSARRVSAEGIQGANSEGIFRYPVYCDGVWHYPPGIGAEAIAEAIMRGERYDANARANSRIARYEGRRIKPVYRDGAWHYPTEVGAEAIAEALARGERSDANQKEQLEEWRPHPRYHTVWIYPSECQEGG